MLKIRKFLLSDLKEVMEIEKLSFPKSRPYPKSYFLRYFKRYPQGFVVIKKAREIIGYTIGELKGGLGELISLAIKPKFRQKGIGTKLTNFLINLFQRRGVKNISLNVRAKNKKAISLYKNLGFEITKKIKKYYRNGDDAYTMEKEI